MKTTKLSLIFSAARCEDGRPSWRTAGFMGVAFVAGLLLSGCSKQEASEEAPTVTVQVGAAETGPIQLKVIADAVLYPRDQAAIVPKIVAPVKKFYVQRGSPVKKDQLLAELENQDLAGAYQKSLGGHQQSSNLRYGSPESHARRETCKAVFGLGAETL